MKASELFGVLVRTMGLFIIVFGMWEILGGFENVAENLVSSPDDQVSSFSYFAFGVPEIFAGLLIFFLAGWIVRAAYWNSDGR